MNRVVKDFAYDKKTLEKLGVIPFTLRKDTLNGEYIISWNTAPRFYSEDMKDKKKRIDYFMRNVKRVGLDDLVIPTQPDDAEACHLLTYEEVKSQYSTPTAHREGTLWNIEKNYDSVFMTRETHYRVLEDFGRSLSLVYPAADCAIVRLFDKRYGKEKDVIGLTHSDFKRTSKNIVGEMLNYMITEFHSNPKNIIVFVGAFAKDGIIYDKYPSFALENKEVWDNYIKRIDDNHYEIEYGDRLYDQLIESGYNPENIYFDSDNNLKNDAYFSNNRAKLLNERDGRNLFGITFDALPVYESVEKGYAKTRFK